MKPLREDRAFLLETGIRFDVEAESLTEWDLDAMQASLEARIAAGAEPILTPPPTTSAATKGLTVLLLVAAIGVAAYATSDSTSFPNAPVVAAPAPAEPAPAVVAEPAAPAVVVESPRKPTVPPTPRDAVSAEARRPGVGLETVAVRVPTPRRRPRRPAKRALVLPPVEAPIEEPKTDVPAIEAPAPVADLAAQMALYDRGKDALDSGAVGPAIAAFREYRRRFPNGQLAREATVSLLEALVRGRRDAAVVALTKRMLGRPAYAGRRTELLRVRADALVRLGRCDEAETAFSHAGVDGRAALERCRGAAP